MSSKKPIFLPIQHGRIISGGILHDVKLPQAGGVGTRPKAFCGQKMEFLTAFRVDQPPEYIPEIMWCKACQKGRDR